jgi:hypothetical protein
MSEKPRVGEILVQAGVIDQMQLASALGEQTRWGRRIGVTLIKMGMVEEGHLVRALATQLDLPLASLAGKRIAADVIALVPKQMATDHGVIPLFVKRDGRTDQLFLGMEDPSNLAILDDLSFRTGMEVHPVMVGPTELGEAMDRYYLGASDSSGSVAMSSSGEISGETIGELSLRVMTEKEVPPGLRPPVESAPVSSDHSGLAPASRDSEIEFTERSSALPDGLLDDVARALDDTQKTRFVAKAIAQLLIEKGILTIEEVRAQIAQQNGD